jgi:hypothetical protein
MDIFDNPFWTLGATLRDNRRRILELAEEKSLLSDEDVITSANSILTNPRKRLGAEIAWLPGLRPKRASELVSMLQSNPNEISHQDGIPSLAKANLLVGGLKSMGQKIEKDTLSEWILGIAEAYDEIDPDDALKLINEERDVSGFPHVTDQHAFDAEIESRRQHFKSVIKDTLNLLDTDELVEVITDVVERSTDMGDLAAPLLIDDLVDTYEIDAQDFLDKEEANIEILLKQIRSLADGNTSDSLLAPVIDELINVVKNWDVVAQPIQVSTKSRGLGHDASTRVAQNVRDVAIHLFNEHDKLDLSRRITAMLQEVFAEVVDVADRTDEDAFTLDDIAEQRKLGDLLDPISDLCTKALKAAEARPKNAHNEATKVASAASRLIRDLNNAGVPETLLNQGKDEIALTLMQCSVVYGNETSKWKECVETLENAMKQAGSPEAKKRIRGNLLTASKNKALYGDLTPISSAPTLSSINGFGFTLYGSTDLDPISHSHIATYYFTALFIPIFPITRYRVIQNGDSYRFLGKAPLRQFDKVHLGISVVLIIAMFLGAQ